MNKIIILAALVASINCHGLMLDPIDRQSAWMGIFSWNGGDIIDFDPLPGFPTYEFNNQWCSEIDPTTNTYRSYEDMGRNVKCGIAGPIYNDNIRGPHSVLIEEFNENKIVYSFEYGSEMYRGTVVRTYKKGQTIDATLEIHANHKGNVQFRICRAPKNADPPMKCFDDNVLSFENGLKEIEMNSVKPLQIKDETTGEIDAEYFNYRVILPKDLVCEHCVLQWKWFRTDTEQIYISAADIAIIN